MATVGDPAKMQILIIAGVNLWSTDASMTGTLTMMQESGIDPDTRIGATETTFRQLIEASLKDTFSEVNEFAYCA